MKYNKIVALGMSFLLLSGNVAFADATVTAANVSEGNNNISIQTVEYQKAYDMMLEKNSELLALQDQIKLQTDAIREAESDATRYGSQPMGNYHDEALEKATIVYVNPIVAKNKKNELIRSLADKKVELREKLVNYYIDWRTKQNNLALYNEVLAIQQKDYDNKNLQYKLGKLAYKDLASAEVNLTTAKSDVATTKRAIDLLLLDYNVTISNNYAFAYQPDKSSIDKVITVGNIDFTKEQMQKIIQADITKDSALAKLAENVAVLKETFRIKQLYGEAGTIESDYKKDVQENKDDTTSRTLAVEYQVYVDYYTMRSLQSDIDSLTENLKLLNIAYNITQSKFKLGMATNLEVMKAKKDIQDAEYKKYLAQSQLFNDYVEFIKNLEPAK